MYIVGGHMDGHGWGEAANDDGSGTALVMELARVFSSPRHSDGSHDPLRALEQ
jgi:Zn-dependent M28 family amino/carboxypeptidase